MLLVRPVLLTILMSVGKKTYERLFTVHHNYSGLGYRSNKVTLRLHQIFKRCDNHMQFFYTGPLRSGINFLA